MKPASGSEHAEHDALLLLFILHNYFLLDHFLQPESNKHLWLKAQCGSQHGKCTSQETGTFRTTSTSGYTAVNYMNGFGMVQLKKKS